MTLRKTLSVLAIGLCSVSFGQQQAQYSQYMRNQYMVNPAAAGVYDFLDITVGGRLQWAGFENAPKSTYIYASTVLKAPKIRYNPSLRTGSGPVKSPEVETGKLKHAVGGQLLADSYGVYRKLSATGTYALHIPVAQDINLSFGTNIGISNNAFMRDKAVVLTQMAGYSGPTMTDTEYDQYVGNQNSVNYFNIGAGLYLYSKKFFVGLSADDLTKGGISFGSGTINIDPQIHFRATAGYKFPISDDWSLTPAFLAKYMAPAPLSFEGSLQAEYMEWMWFGFSYRSSNAAIVMLGLNLNEKFKFGYSYDLSLNQMSNYSSGGHELVLGIMLGR